MIKYHIACCLCPVSHLLKSIFKILIIWLGHVLVVTGSTSLTRDQTQAACIGSTES